MTIMMFCQADY